MTTDDWDPEPADLREGETSDDDAHARRNAEQLRIARDDLDDDLETLDVGDHVEDREDPDATMLVVGTPPRRAKTYEIDDDGTTVADVNPDYPAADHVVEVVFPEQTSVDVGNLRRYAYPRERLRRSEAIHNEEGATDA